MTAGKSSWHRRAARGPSASSPRGGGPHRWSRKRLTVSREDCTVVGAKPRWWHHHAPAGSIVDVAVKASSANGPDAHPYDYDLLIAAVTAMVSAN